MSTAEQLEREAEQTRSQISDTLNELRASMTPGQVLDQLADRVGNAGGTALVSNLKRQTIDNPVPVALIGAGLAWLMFGGRPGLMARGEGRYARRGADWTEVAGRKVEESRDATNQKAAELGDKASSLADTVRAQAALAASGQASPPPTPERPCNRRRIRSGNPSGRTRPRAMKRSPAARGGPLRQLLDRPALRVRGRFEPAMRWSISAGSNQWCWPDLALRSEPCSAALLPGTEAEERLMGEPSANLQERAQDLAAEQSEAAKKVGEKALDAATDEAAKQTGQQEQVASSDSTLGDRDSGGHVDR